MSHYRRRRWHVRLPDPDADIFVRMPDFGDQYFPEKLVTGWFVGDGDPVEVGDPLLTVSTDKADVDVPSPATGVLEIHAEKSTTVRAGEIVATIHTSKQNRQQPNVEGEDSDGRH
jgi:pyruvate/2-oxoglutarate dehydrogenase complex dihydrolipoamide acyltransferase (E2) component